MAAHSEAAAGSRGAAVSAIRSHAHVPVVSPGTGNGLPRGGVAPAGARKAARRLRILKYCGLD
jgi:hypothetical protein